MPHSAKSSNFVITLWEFRQRPAEYRGIEKRGHFAAREQPELFSEEIRAALRSLRWFTLATGPARVNARRAR
jgi:pimeloyl-ACP methyl ester carboxylesterase